MKKETIKFKKYLREKKKFEKANKGSNYERHLIIESFAPFWAATNRISNIVHGKTNDNYNNAEKEYYNAYINTNKNINEIKMIQGKLNRRNK